MVDHLKSVNNGYNDSTTRVRDDRFTRIFALCGFSKLADFQQAHRQLIEASRAIWNTLRVSDGCATQADQSNTGISSNRTGLTLPLRRYCSWFKFSIHIYRYKRHKIRR